MRIVFFITALCLSLFATELHLFDDYDKALKEAKAQNKDVYMLITSETCPWCRKFEKRTLEDEFIIKKLQKDYIVLSLVRGFDDIPEQYSAKRVPKHYFLTKNEKQLYSVVGYWNSEDFASLLQDVKRKSQSQKKENSK